MDAEDARKADLQDYHGKRHDDDKAHDVPDCKGGGAGWARGAENREEDPGR